MKKILVLENGTEFEIKSDDGRYWDCGETRILKSNPSVKTIRTVKEEKNAEDGRPKYKQNVVPRETEKSEKED